MALAADGRADSEPVKKAAEWLAARQTPDGGFPLSPAAPSNAQSTAFAIQALVAAGRDADEILAELDRRLQNDDATERAETVDNLRQIALLRLEAEL